MAEKAGGSRSGLWSESRIFGFAVHPKQPRTVLAGADDGVYHSEDGGEPSSG